MRKTETSTARIEELRAMLASYRLLTIEEAEQGNWGDVQVELEGELWRLEQELSDRRRRRLQAA
jgi:hypothetical protein